MVFLRPILSEILPRKKPPIPVASKNQATVDTTSFRPTEKVLAIASSTKPKTVASSASNNQAAQEPPRVAYRWELLSSPLASAGTASAVTVEARFFMEEPQETQLIVFRKSSANGADRRTTVHVKPMLVGANRGVYQALASLPSRMAMAGGRVLRGIG